MDCQRPAGMLQTCGAPDGGVHIVPGQLPNLSPIQNKNSPNVATASSTNVTPVASVNGGDKTVPVKKNENMRCTLAELDLLLTVMEEILPMGKNDWERVESRFNHNVPEARHRTQARLRAQFHSLCAKKPPAGDPNCPPEVRRAKRVRFQIRERANMEVIQGDQDAPTFHDNGPDDDGAKPDKTGSDATVTSVATNSTTGALVAKSRTNNETSSMTLTATRAAARNARKKSDVSELVDAFVRSEEKNSEREALRLKQMSKLDEKHRELEARLEEKRRDDMRQCVQMGLAALTTLALACTGKTVKLPEAVVGATKPVDSKSSSCALSSDDESDVSFKTHLRLRRKKKRCRENQKMWSKKRTTRILNEASDALKDMKNKKDKDDD